MEGRLSVINLELVSAKLILALALVFGSHPEPVESSLFLRFDHTLPMAQFF
jgi:hypothetical protein